MANLYNIAVIGCGVIGLTSALEIQKRLGVSAKVTIFTEKVSPDTTSDVAAGVWAPYLLQDTDPEKVGKWARSTLNYVLQLWKEGKAKEAGICLQPMIYLTDVENFKLPEWLNFSVGFTELSSQYLKHISKKVNQTFTGGYMVTTVSWEGSIFLPYLQQQFISNGGNIVIKSIKTLAELKENDIVINCTGINSKYLAKDAKVHPIRGQVIRVEAPWQFISYITDMKDEKSSCYILINQNCLILGGTKQKEYNLNVDETDTQRIIENCNKMIPALKDAKILKHQVGLRPARNQVRLEAERLAIDDKYLTIVHNYGHGGAGITLSVGCAIDTADLVEKSLKDTALTSKL